MLAQCLLQRRMLASLEGLSCRVKHAHQAASDTVGIFFSYRLSLCFLQKMRKYDTYELPLGINSNSGLGNRTHIFEKGQDDLRFDSKLRHLL